MADKKQLIDFAVKNVQLYAPTLDHNAKLFQIYEGNLLDQILQDISQQFSIESYNVIKARVAPINVLKRIVDKLSTIYSKPIKRSIINGNKQDEELLAWYEENFDINNAMNIANELFNLHKTVVVEPYIDEGLPKLRSVPSDRSLMFSQDKVDPTRPTMWVKLMGKMYYKGVEKEILYIYTDEYFIPITMEGEVVDYVLLEAENPGGENPIGALPSVYISQSNHCLIPQIDTDMLRMTKIIPLLISDLNYSVMFQSFSILYGVNVDTSNLRMSPNAFWNFKSDPTSDQKPEIGVIKPTVDIQQVVQFIQAQLTFWLNSKNIRPGTIGGLAAENFASGISKAIDEMDTVEARQKQVPYFMKAEKQLWTLIIKKLHPYWKSQGLIDTPLNFSSSAQIKIEFPEQLPMSDRATVLSNLKLELDMKLTTKKIAIQTLNPEFSDEEVDELLLEIEEENTQDVQVPDNTNNPQQDLNQPMDNQQNQQDNLNGKGQALPV